MFGRRKRWSVIPLALIAAYAAFGISWSMANAPFASPDETQHYLRALGIHTDNALVGPRTAYTGPLMSTVEGTEWRRKLTRAATVPPGMSPTGLDCMIFFQLNVTPRCADSVAPNQRTIVEDTNVGSYAPVPYLLPAIATSLGDDATSAARYGRFASLAMWLAMIAAAMWMLWDRRVGGLSLMGLVVAVTPTAVFIGSSLSNSGLEIAASVAFFSALLRLTRTTDENQRAAWTVVAISGALLVLSRSLGVVWVACGLAVYIALVGRSGIRATVTRSPRATALAAGGLLLAGALTAAWELTYGPRVGATLVPSVSVLYDGAWQLRHSLVGVVGLFGYQDVPLGAFGFGVWVAMATVLFGLAVRFGTAGERRALAVALALAVAAPIYIYAAVTRQQGIVTMGRHLLPLAVIMPLLCGEILRRHVEELSRAWSVVLFPVFCGAAAGIQLLAWWINARRYAVGVDGPFWFLSDPLWSPPGGWIPWAVLAVGAAILVVGAAAANLASGLSRRSGGSVDARG